MGRVWKQRVGNFKEEALTVSQVRGERRSDQHSAQAFAADLSEHSVQIQESEKRCRNSSL
jgi:hypothetical protein